MYFVISTLCYTRQLTNEVMTNEQIPDASNPRSFKSKRDEWKLG